MPLIRAELVELTARLADLRGDGLKSGLVDLVKWAAQQLTVERPNGRRAFTPNLDTCRVDIQKQLRGQGVGEDLPALLPRGWEGRQVVSGPLPILHGVLDLSLRLQ